MINRDNFGRIKVGQHLSKETQFKRRYSEEELKLRRKLYFRKYYLQNKEKVKIKNQKWLENNREKRRAYEKLWRKTSPVRQAWEEKNKKKIRLNANKRAKRYRNSEKGILKQKVYQNSEKYKKYHKEYWRTENGKIKNKIRNLKRRNTISNKRISEQELKIIMNRDTACVYCKDNQKKLSVEHIIAFDNGGEDIFHNVVMACLSCNKSKRNREVFAWCKYKKREVPELIIENLRKMNKLPKEYQI